MENQDPLSDLADIHLPGEISVWPPALGWWLLAAALCLLALYYLRVYIIHLMRLKRLSFATSELEQAYQTFSEQVLFRTKHNQAGLVFLNEINSILRRVALLIFPDNPDIAKLNGNKWLAFLDNTGNSQDFTQGPGKVLGDGSYQRHFEADGDALYTVARHWIEQRYKQQTVNAMKSSESLGQTS